MLTLITFEIPTGVRAWIEDVVVDDAGPGSRVAGCPGAGRRWTVRPTSGPRTVDLTSRPDREAANRLYLRMGFETRETNVYRKTLDTGGDAERRPGSGRSAHPMATMGALRARPPVDPLKAASP